ncbi:MAG: DNA-3-methyladenine glycosylase I [Bacteroidales bacterium]|nr:DNA-3-methyladenine glycosylase I [Bacteroidales bacterium]
MTEIKRCNWPGTNALMIQYHDNEWGVPLHDDDKLFEFLVLDAFQAGLSWQTILNKREAFREAFDGFNAEKIAFYDNDKIEKLLQNAGIVRNRLKVLSAITNAQAFLRIQKEYGRFDRFIWQFTDGKTIVNTWETMTDIPAKSKESDAMSKALIKEGFKFVGSTICYAFMQAAGMVNDHLTNCFRYETCKDLSSKNGS